MSGHLIDTDWAIDYLRGDAQVAHDLQRLGKEVRFISIISVAELWEGIYGARDPSAAQAKLDELLAGVGILGIDVATARIFGEHRARLRQEGRLIDNLDLLIAATCLQHGLRILTNNVAHFERIEGLQIGIEEG